MLIAFWVTLTLGHMDGEWTSAEQKDWSKLRAHMKHCKNEACGCEQYYRLFADWSEQLPLLHDESHPASKKTWLWHRISKRKDLDGCVLCENLRHRFLRSARRADVEKADRCKLSNLKRHARSPFHLQQVAKFLQLPSPDLRSLRRLKQLLKSCMSSFARGLR